MGNIFSSKFMGDADAVQVPMRPDDSHAAKYMDRATETMKALNETAKRNNFPTLPKTVNSAQDATNVLNARTTQLTGALGNLMVVRAANDTSVPSVAQAKNLGVDQASGNAFTQPGVVTRTPVAATPQPDLGPRVYDGKGNFTNYAPPAAPTNTVAAPQPVNTPTQQLGDLDKQMTAQSLATWGPIESLPLVERLRAEKTAAYQDQQERMGEAANAITRRRRGGR